MLRQEPESWVFKFNPGRRLRALFWLVIDIRRKALDTLHDKEELDA